MKRSEKFDPGERNTELSSHLQRYDLPLPSSLSVLSCFVIALHPSCHYVTRFYCKYKSSGTAFHLPPRNATVYPAGKPGYVGGNDDDDEEEDEEEKSQDDESGGGKKTKVKEEEKASSSSKKAKKVTGEVVKERESSKEKAADDKPSTRQEQLESAKAMIPKMMRQNPRACIDWESILSELINEGIPLVVARIKVPAPTVY